MTEQKQTLGQAIDQIIGALEPLEAEARATVVATVCSHLRIPVASASQRPLEPTPQRDVVPATPVFPGSITEAPTPRATTDIRSFRTEKKPRSAREMACVVAFYLKELAPEGERKDNISTADLDKYFKQAQFKLPQRMAQILVDCKSSGYFDSSGRGEYKLNAVGYNLVAHNLPPKSDNT